MLDVLPIGRAAAVGRKVATTVEAEFVEQASEAVLRGGATFVESKVIQANTTVQLREAVTLAGGKVLPKGSVVTVSDDAMKVVYPNGVSEVGSYSKAVSQPLLLPGAKETVGTATTSGAKVVPDKISPQQLDLVTSHPNAHSLSVHGGGLSDGALMLRAKSAIKPNGDVGPSVPPLSSAFHSDELLVFADQTVRNSGALQKAMTRQPGQDVIRVTVDDVGDIGADLGRGFKRVLPGGNKAANAGAHGAPIRVDNLRSVEELYQFNSSKKAWETISIFPAPLP